MMREKKPRKYAILIFTIDFFFKKKKESKKDDKCKRNTYYFVEFEQTKYIILYKHIIFK